MGDDGYTIITPYYIRQKLYWWGSKDNCCDDKENDSFDMSIQLSSPPLFF
jgi:hypothetical protein